MANEENLEEEIKNQESEEQLDAQETETTEEETSEQEVEQIELSLEEKLQAELAEQKEKFLRLYSEFENFRKRTAKEKLDLIATGNESLILSILPVVDDFDRALKANEESDDAQAIKDGVVLIKDKFIKSLEAKGLKEIVIEENGAFDTELHEAITQIPSPTEEQKGKVIDCVEKGYMLGEKVIRYSKVVVGA